MLDNSDMDNLDLDDFYHENDLDSISESCSSEESGAKFRSRGIAFSVIGKHR